MTPPRPVPEWTYFQGIDDAVIVGCSRCGARERVALPLTMAEIARRTAEWGGRHRACGAGGARPDEGRA